MGWAVEAEEEVIETDLAVRGETIAHGGEVDGAVRLVYLDGVSSAERDVRAAFASKMREDSLGADSAGGVGFGGIDLAALVVPQVEGEEGAADEVGLVGEEFEGFGDLDGGGEVDGGGEDARGITGFDGAGWGFGEDAGEAGSRGYVASLRLER